MIRKWRNLNRFTGNRIPPGMYVAGRIYLGSVRPALSYFAASFRRPAFLAGFLATTLSHLLECFEMVVASGSLGYLNERGAIE